MKTIVKNIINNKEKTIPVLSFPSTQLLDINVQELICSSENQAKGMQAIAQRCPIGASLNMMDLSVEAEAFGAKILFTEDEIPTVTKGAIQNISEAQNLQVPRVGTARTDIYIEGVLKAKNIIKDIPIFCGVIGPYSLAGRLFDMTELMMACFDSKDDVDCLLQKCTSFLIEYIKSFKKAGANGVVLAEPAAGLLSPDLCEDFSCKYVKQIIETVSDDDFVFCYHNCGNTIPLAQNISALNADIYHFGNAIDLSELIPLMPKNKIIMGNIDPVLFKTGSKEDVVNETNRILNKCSKYDNFMISSGCDIPALAKWENISAYFDTVEKFYKYNK